MIVIEGPKMLWKENWNHRITHMMMTLKGGFKGEKNLRWNCVTLADQTKISINTRRWISWILYRRCDLEKQEMGLFFDRDKRSKESIGNYDPMFRNLLELGQTMHLKMFTTKFFIGDYSLRRSPHCGATTEV